MKLFEKFEKNDEAVSPVIGVILMVAITVILAAVIAAFVFGMAGNMSSTKNVAATATQQGSEIIVTFQGGSDVDDVSTLNWSIDGAEQANTLENKTGSSATGSGTAGKDHVIVTASFNDGSSQVVLDTFV